MTDWLTQSQANNILDVQQEETAQSVTSISKIAADTDEVPCE